MNPNGAICGSLLIVLWVSLALLANHSEVSANALANKLFAPALAVTYICIWLIAASISRQRKKVLFTSVMATLTLAVVVALCEMPAALGLIHWERTFRLLGGEARQYDATYVTDPELSFRRIPELQWTETRIGDVEKVYGLRPERIDHLNFTYDKWGYRNTIDIHEAQVVLIGDSFVEGHNVSDDETVASYLQGYLGQNVVNLGIAGYGTLQMLRVIKGDAIKRRPKSIVWFFFEGNDLYDDHTFENAMLASHSEVKLIAPRNARQRSWNERSFVNAVYKRIRHLSQPLFPKRPPYWAYLSVGQQEQEVVYFFDYGAVPWTDYEEARWRRAEDALLEGARFCEARGIDLIITYIPTKYRVYRDFIDVPKGSPISQWSVWPLPALFKKFCMTNDLHCIDLTRPLEEHTRASGNPYFHTDTHWSPAGHDLVASVLAETLREKDR